MGGCSCLTLWAPQRPPSCIRTAGGLRGERSGLQRRQEETTEQESESRGAGAGLVKLSQKH